MPDNVKGISVLLLEYKAELKVPSTLVKYEFPSLPFAEWTEVHHSAVWGKITDSLTSYGAVEIKKQCLNFNVRCPRVTAK